MIKRPVEMQVFRKIAAENLLKKVLSVLTRTQAQYFLIAALTGGNAYDVADEVGVSHQAVDVALRSGQDTVRKLLSDDPEVKSDLDSLGKWFSKG